MRIEISVAGYDASFRCLEIIMMTAVSSSLLSRRDPREYNKIQANLNVEYKSILNTLIWTMDVTSGLSSLKG